VRVLDFLAAQADRLRQIRADAESGRATRLIRRQRRLQQRTPAEDPGPRALVIDDEAPDRSRDAGSQAVLSHMQALQALGYRVSFVAAADPAVDEDAAARLAADGIAVCRSPFYASVEEVLRRQAGGFDLIYLHRISNASAYLALARQHCPRARLIYAVADLHHLRLARQAQIEGRPELLGQSRRLRLAECTASLSTDVVITHSPREADWLRTTLPDANVHVVPWAIPHRRSGADWPARGGVAFIANFAHAPNQDAARVLAEDIMPLVWRQAPDIECSLIGSRMPDRIRRLARPGLVAVGHVPDLGSILGSVRLTVAPLRFGAGLKGKVLESLAAGTPCVMSPIAAEGIDLPAVLAGLVADSAADIAERILLLHADKAAWRRASRAGSAFMKTAFTAEHVTAALRHAIAPGAGMAMEEAERTVAMRN
jgi:glycosyltransferase involved in cell wall biosynthesis